MRRSMRKGFTLVELLIVIAVLGSLSAAMTMSASTATAKAKATSIANNLKIFTSGAQVYRFEHDDDIGTVDVDTTTMLSETVPNFSDFTNAGDDDNDTILYAAIDADADDNALLGPDNWTIEVTLNGTDKSDIVTALKNIKGFKGLADATDDADYVITYNVFSGTVQ